MTILTIVTREIRLAMVMDSNNGQGINTNSTSEGLRNIHPPYRFIIANFITYVFRITMSKDW